MLVSFQPSLNTKIIDYTSLFKNKAIEYARIMAITEGIAVGLSSGGINNLFAGMKLGININDGSKSIDSGSIICRTRYVNKNYLIITHNH